MGAADHSWHSKAIKTNLPFLNIFNALHRKIVSKRPGARLSGLLYDIFSKSKKIKPCILLGELLGERPTPTSYSRVTHIFHALHRKIVSKWAGARLSGLAYDVFSKCNINVRRAFHAVNGLKMLSLMTFSVVSCVNIQIVFTVMFGDRNILKLYHYIVSPTCVSATSCACRVTQQSNSNLSPHFCTGILSPCELTEADCATTTIGSRY